MTGEALTRIEAADTPFYTFVQYWDTHVPYEVPARFTEQFGDPSGSRARYAGGIAYVDTQFQRLMSKLEDQGLREDTLILVMADHGESLGEHGIYNDHHDLSDAPIHVPIVLSHPDLPTTTVDSFVQHVDHAPPPTVLDALGESIPEDMHGHSLLSMVEDYSDARSAVVVEEAQTQRKICNRTERYKHIRLLDDDPVCRGCHMVNGGDEEPYDLWEDPDETRNLADERPDVTDRLGARLSH